MKSTKKAPNALLALLVAATLLFGCADGGNESNENDAPESTTIRDSEQNVAEFADYDTWDKNEEVVITMSGTGASVEGGNVSVEPGLLTIGAEGIYVLRGSFEGQIVIDAGKTDMVQLVLDGADIRCEDNAAIYAPSAGTTVVYLAEGSSNRLSDGTQYQYAEASADEPDAALFAKNDLTISGEGALFVTGNYNNGIGCKDNLLILGGEITVESANHGIRGRDSITVVDGSLEIKAGNDGIQSNNDSGEDKGWISLRGGSYRIEAAHDGIQAESSLSIDGGSFRVLSGGGSTALAVDADGSYKGLKACADLTIAGGSFELDCADDTIHANGNVTILDGQFLMSSGDDGIHADEKLSISGGSIEITQSYEGLEGSSIEISGGVIRLVASDDGINVAGGSDTGEGRFGRDRFQISDDMYLRITGGWISVTADGDGVDSNSHIEMSGGTLLVNGPTSNGDAAIDYDGTFTFTGGVLAAAGSSGMAQAPSDAQQPVLMITYSAVQPGGTPVHVAAEDGTPLITFVPSKSYQSIVISTPEFENEANYSVYTGGTATETEDGLTIGGAYAEGTRLFQVTLLEGTTRVNDAGEAVTGGMGGFGGMGGGRPGNMGEGEFPERGGPGGQRQPGAGPQEDGGPSGDMRPPGSLR